VGTLVAGYLALEAVDERFFSVVDCACGSIPNFIIQYLKTTPSKLQEQAVRKKNNIKHPKSRAYPRVPRLQLGHRNRNPPVVVGTGLRLVHRKKLCHHRWSARHVENVNQPGSLRGAFIRKVLDPTKSAKRSVPFRALCFPTNLRFLVPWSSSCKDGDWDIRS